MNGLKRSRRTREVYRVYFHFLNELRSAMFLYILWVVVLDTKCGGGFEEYCIVFV